MSWLRRRIAEVQVAFILLTRLPAGRLEGDAPELAAAKWAFPLAGLVVGGSLAGVYIAMNSLGLPAELAAILALGASVMMTGGLHEDGLADCADGFGGGAPSQKCTYRFSRPGEASTPVAAGAPIYT